MRAVIQRVSRAEVRVAGEPVGKIGPGLCVFLGIGKADGQANVEHLAEKIKNLRIFEDENGKMNLSVEVRGRNFGRIAIHTCMAIAGRAIAPPLAMRHRPIKPKNYTNISCGDCRGAGLTVATGQFKARMDVTLINDGPVTFIVES